MSKVNKNEFSTSQPQSQMLYGIFDFIKPEENTKLSDIKGLDLQELLILIDEYYLTLRNRLEFDETVTFGLELEFEHAEKERIINKLNNSRIDKNWIHKKDNSLPGGFEINSPKSFDVQKSWIELKKVCSIVRSSATIGENSGGHVHVGAQVLGNKRESFLNFLKMWAVYENIFYRFLYGEYLGPRPNILEYASPVSKFYLNAYKELKTNTNNGQFELIKTTKYLGVNIKNMKFLNSKGKNTIEFRSPNGTLEPVIWQNNVNLLVNILQYCNSSKFNNDTVEKRHIINLETFWTLENYDSMKIDRALAFYNEIYIDQALELCDMLFDNNLDKIYFLRQYLKSFEVTKKGFELAKTFIKQ